MENFKNAFDWDIKQAPIYDAQGNVIKGYKEITRDDDDSTIAVMKNSFTPMTTQQFVGVAEEVAGIIGCDIVGYEDWKNGDNMGKRKHIVTAQLKLSEPFSISGSKMEGYLTLGVGFDGNRSFYIGSSQNYLRCANQFGNIIKDFTSRLTVNNMVRVQDIIKNIETYREYEAKLYENLSKFREVKIDEKLMQECLARLVKLSDEERIDKSIISTQKLNKMDEIMASVRTECSELGYNAFGIFNSVTHFSTHVMSSRSEDYFGNMFGAKGEFNKTGYNFCLEVAGLQ
jgi:hypothetical protein